MLTYSLFVEYQNEEIRLDLVEFSSEDDYLGYWGNELITAKSRTWEWPEVIDLINKYKPNEIKISERGY